MVIRCRETEEYEVEMNVMVNNELMKKIAYSCRTQIVKLGMKGCFVGSALSCIDTKTYLYYSGRVSVDNKKGYFLLSKGHAVPAQYAVIESLGAIDGSRFDKFNSIEDDIYLHPNAKIPGINIHSGSLGHGIAIATGIALDLKQIGDPRSVYVLVGDGELNEGTNWEALLIANAKKLSNLCIIVDRNHFQANFPTEELIPLEPLEEKFKSFGANVVSSNGHDFDAIDVAFEKIRENTNSVNIFIAETVRGKGIPSIEGDWKQWYMEYDEVQCDRLINELVENMG